MKRSEKLKEKLKELREGKSLETEDYIMSDYIIYQIELLEEIKLLLENPPLIYNLETRKYQPTNIPHLNNLETK